MLLDGLETYYVGFDIEQIEFLHLIAEKNDLLESIETNFHGLFSCQEGEWQN